jgi:ankyrin repeat protein
MRIYLNGMVGVVLALGLAGSTQADRNSATPRANGARKRAASKFDPGATAKLKQMLETAEHSVHGAYVASQAERLVRDGADPNVANSTGSTVMHFAAGQGDLKTLKLSLKEGGKPNACDHLGNTPLHNAACAGNIEALQSLLAAGASINAKSRAGMTPLDMAYRLGQKDAETFLRARGGQITLGVKKLAPNPNGRPLH